MSEETIVEETEVEEIEETTEVEDNKAEPEKGKTGAWRAQFPDDLKENEAFTKFEKLGDLGKDYLDLKGKLENSIQLPGEDATDEEKAEYNRKMGVPEKYEDYEVVMPENIPEGIDVEAMRNPEFENAMKKVAFDAGVSKEAYAKLTGAFNAAQIQLQEAYIKANNEAYNESQKALETDWGPKYKENMELTKRVIKNYGGDEFIEFLVDSKLTNDPRMAKTLFNIAQVISDDKFISGSVDTTKASELLDTIYPKMKT